MVVAAAKTVESTVSVSTIVSSQEVMLVLVVVTVASASWVSVTCVVVSDVLGSVTSMVVKPAWVSKLVDVTVCVTVEVVTHGVPVTVVCGTPTRLHADEYAGVLHTIVAYGGTWLTWVVAAGQAAGVVVAAFRLARRRRRRRFLPAGQPLPSEGGGSVGATVGWGVGGASVGATVGWGVDVGASVGVGVSPSESSSRP